MGLADGSDGVGAEEFDDAAEVVVGVVLGAHLGHDAGFTGGEADGAAFGDVVGEGFFAVDVFFEVQGWHGGVGVGVLGGADDDGVVEVGVVVDFTEVVELFGFGVFFGGFFQEGFVDIADGDDVLAGHLLEVVFAATADGDHGDVELVVEVTGAEDRGSREGAEGGGCGGFEELPTRRGMGLTHRFLTPLIPGFWRKGRGVASPPRFWTNGGRDATG